MVMVLEKKKTRNENLKKERKSVYWIQSLNPSLYVTSLVKEKMYWISYSLTLEYKTGMTLFSNAAETELSWDNIAQ